MSTGAFIGASIVFFGLAVANVGAEIIERSFGCHCTPVYIYQRSAYTEDCDQEATPSTSESNREGNPEERG